MNAESAEHAEIQIAELITLGVLGVLGVHLLRFGPNTTETVLSKSSVAQRHRGTNGI